MSQQDFLTPVRSPTIDEPQRFLSGCYANAVASRACIKVSSVILDPNTGSLVE